MLAGVVMGSQSDFTFMQAAAEVLVKLAIPHEVKVVSAHRDLDVIVASAGGAAHLPGMLAAKTVVPVLGVPIPTTSFGSLGGMDSLLSIVRMPRGCPVATFGIGEAGAVNAALFAARMLAARYPEVWKALEEYRG